MTLLSSVVETIDNPEDSSGEYVLDRGYGATA